MVQHSADLTEQALQQVEGLLKRTPDVVALRIEQARLLIELERLEEAKNVYLGILTREPTQLVALNNLGALLNMMGFHKAALLVYREVVRLEPDNNQGRLNLADTLRDCAEIGEARGQYEIVLQKAPDDRRARLGFSYVLSYQLEKETAWEQRKKAGAIQHQLSFSGVAKDGIPPILLLVSPCGGNSPITQFLHQNFVQALKIVPDFHPPDTILPPHQLVINAIGDADHCATSLETAQPIVARTTAPVLNLPAQIRKTGRVDNARLLGTLEGVVTPKIATFAKAILAGSNGVTEIERAGFAFPLLLRTPGFHEGSHFVRVESADALASAASALPGENILAIEYLDARDDDGKIRKYRVMMIDGRLYPLHKAISPRWMIHYFSADMVNSPEHRAEDEAFLRDMPGVLGAKAMAALERICGALGLDYAGADFSLDRDGRVLLFEANATMAVPNADPGEIWSYRREPVRKIQDAIRRMILTRAQPKSA